MTTLHEQEKIRHLIQKYSGANSTEELIALVADNNGMLEACEMITEKDRVCDKELIDWLKEECHNKRVDIRSLLFDLDNLLRILKPDPQLESFSILELEPGADQSEIRNAYRRLSKKYHPDLNAHLGEEGKDRFLQISQAYRALLQPGIQESGFEQLSNKKTYWRQENRKRTSRESKKKTIILVAIFSGLLTFISITASIHYQKRIMLSGLQSSGGSGSFQKDEGGAELHAEDQEYNQQSFPETENALNINDFSASKQTSTVKNYQMPGEQKGIVDSKSFDEKKNRTAISREEASLSLQPALETSFPNQAVSLNQRVKDQNFPDDPKIIRKNSSKKVAVSSAKVDPKDSPAEHIGLENSNIRLTGGTLSKKVEKIVAKSDNVEKNIPQTKIDVAIADSEKKLMKDEASNKGTQSEVENIIDLTTSVFAIETSDKKNLEKTDLDQFKEVPITQDLIETFLSDYIEAYEQKNIVLFSRFFTLDAVENDKPLQQMIPDYISLFKATNSILLSFDDVQWRMNNGKVSVMGNFDISLDYIGKGITTGSGKIEFLLIFANNILQISSLNYEFN